MIAFTGRIRLRTGPLSGQAATNSLLRHPMLLACHSGAAFEGRNPPPFAGARNPLRHGILMFGIPISARLSYFQRLLLSMPPAIMQVLYTVA